MSHFIAKIICLVLSLLAISSSQEYPKLYDHFTEGGITSGLVAGNKEFRLNGKYIRIISGTVFYYRNHPDLLRDAFRKLRALGANAVETYNTWNLHEPRRGQFDFGNGTNDFSEFMNIRRYMKIAQEEDLLVIMRPGPLINSEWDFGGQPSWLLQDPNLKIRQNYQPYLQRVKVYLDALLSEVVDLQFTRGGPIIAMQIENEFGDFSAKSRDHLEWIRDNYLANGFGDTLFFTADNKGWKEYAGAIPGVLQTANGHDIDNAFSQLLEVQPDMPLMVMEFYPGWLSHWFETWKGSRDHGDYLSNLEIAFEKYDGSINIYPFQGGSNHGFMSGSNTNAVLPYIKPVIQSYDFDAVLTEAGDYSALYNITYDVVAEYENPKLWRPARPAERRKVAYPTIQLHQYLTYNDIIKQIPASHKITGNRTLSMEELPINNNNGQSYGYIIYRIFGRFGNTDVYKISKPKDFAQLIIDGEQIDTGFTQHPRDYWISQDKEFQLGLSSDENHVVDVMIENLGRTSHGTEAEFVQNKGLPSNRQSKLELNGQEVKSIEHIALEFTNSWVKSLTNWRTGLPANLKPPCLIRTNFAITGEPLDTYLDMREWHKGIVFINGFNIGRYWKVGPQLTIYIASVFLKTGQNEIIIFEQLEAGKEIQFLEAPILGTPDHNQPPSFSRASRLSMHWF